LKLITFAVLAAMLLARPTEAAETAAAGRVLVLEHVQLIDGRTNAVRPDMTIVIRGEDIAEVRSTVPADLPDSAFVLDLHGAWLMPGLIDSHVHISHESRSATENALERALRGGVTTVRDMGGDARRLASLRRDAWLGDIIAPDIYYSAVFAGPEFFTDPRVVDVSRGAKIGEAAWARAIRPETDVNKAVLEAKGAGASAIKIYADLAPTDLAHVTTAAHAQGLRVWSHAAVFPSRPSDAVAAGVDVISHASMLYWQTTREVPKAYGPHRNVAPPATDAVNSPALAPLFAEMKRRGTILDATLYVGQLLATTTTDSARKAYWEGFQAFAVAATRVAHASGVRIDSGTDSMIEDGQALPNLHEELRLLVTSGLSPMEALQAATRVGADVLGLGDRLGTVEAGKRANLVVLSADPTARIENSKNIRFVVKAGRLIAIQ
jgi:imidazolonepropionase-like amidohydrolase